MSTTTTPTPAVEPRSASGAQPVRRTVWGDRFGVAALGVLATMLVWRAVLLGSSFFNQDDYVLTARGFDVPLTWGFLVEPNSGHVNPAQQLTYWLVANHAPYDWSVIAAFVLLLQTVATVVMWHVLRRLLPGRWVAVALLAAFAWSPLTLMTTLWWSAAMGLWPHLVCSLLAVLFLLRAEQHDGRRWANYAGCLVAAVVGVLWHERAVLIAPVVFAVAVAMADDAVGWRRLVLATKRHRPLWASYVVLVVGYLVVHQSLTSVQGGGTTLGGGLSIAWAYVGQNVLPGIVSGPWAADLQGGAVVPPLWVTVLALLLVAAVVTVVVRSGGPARRWALALFVAYVSADLALVLAGRGGFGRLIGLDPRYSSDVIHVAVLAVALALRGSPAQYAVTLPTRVSWQRARTGVLAVGVLAYLVGAAFGSAVLVPHFQNTADRTYVANFRDDLAADPDQVVSDALVPAGIVLPLVGDDSLLSRVFATLPESPDFDQPSAHLRTVTSDGHLVPVELAGAIPAVPGPVPGCGYAVKQATTPVPLMVEIGGRVVVNLGYFTDAESTVEVSVGRWNAAFQAQPGPNEMWLTLPDQGQLQSLDFRVDGSGTVCVTSLEAGRPEPQESP